MDEVALFICDNGEDNKASTTGFVSEAGEEVAFSVSQSRAGGKPRGQDAIGATSRGSLECCVLCDGHDAHGDLVARAVCSTLAFVVLDKLAALPESSHVGTPEATEAILDAFYECEHLVMWTNENINQNSFVKVVVGEFEGKVGYVSDVHADGGYSVIIIDARKFHKPKLQRNQLKCAKYTGGCTCVAYVRDASRNLARIAVMGDTRALLIRGKKSGLESDPIFEEIVPGAFLSYPHDVFNTAELHRIQTEFDPKDYEIDGPYLINPFTGCEIQPTRGFGDFDMYGSGFITEPDISQPFSLPKGSLLLVASDGIFDDQVWDFKELVKYVEQNYFEANRFPDLESFASELHTATIKKSMTGGYVDDISFFMCCVEPPARAKKASTAVAAMPLSDSPKKSVSAAASNSANVANLARLESTSVSSTGSMNTRKVSAVPSFVEASAARKASGLPPLSPIKLPLPMSLRKTSVASDNVNGAAPTTSAAGAGRKSRSMTFDTVPSRKGTSSFSKSAVGAGHTRAHTLDDAQPKYLSGLRRSFNLGGAGKQLAETLRRTHGPSYTLPDGVNSPSAIDILGGKDVADGLASKALDHLSNESITKKAAGASAATAATAAASSRSMPNGKNLSASPRMQDMKEHSANTVLQRIALRFGHDLDALEQLIKDIDIV